jgi:PAS domain S-box-containing protein
MEGSLVDLRTDKPSFHLGLPPLDRWDVSPLQAAPVAIALVDRLGRIVYANPYLEEMFGYARGELQDRLVEILVPERLRTAHIRHRHHYLQNPHVRTMGWGMDLAGLRKDGSEFPIEAGLNHLEIEQTTFALVTIVDISPRKHAEEALRMSEERFRLLVEALHDHAVYLMDPQGVIVSWNSGATQIKGYSADEIIGRNYSCFFTQEELAQGEPERLLQMARTQGSLTNEGLRVRKDGSRFWANTTITAIYDHAGRLQGFGKITRDITERKQTAQLLEARVLQRTRELERRRQVAEGLQDILAMLNTNRTLPEILEFLLVRALNLFQASTCAIYQLEGQSGLLKKQVSAGLFAPEFLRLAIPDPTGTNAAFSLQEKPLLIFDLTQPLLNWAPAGAEFQQRLLKAGYRALSTMPLVIKDEAYGVLVTFYKSSHFFTDEEIELARAFCHQAALAIEHEQLRLLLEATAVTTERNRLARELHDAVTQTLFAASIIADALPVIWERNPDHGRKRLTELRELARGALAEMRTLLLELRPAKLMELELSELLQQLADGVIGRGRVPVRVYIDCLEEFPADVKFAFYRIAQEALNNVVKHAQASQVVVRLSQSDSEVFLIIEDDGQGFEFSHIHARNLGLSIMRERADAISAVLAIQSQPNQGTKIKVVWPKGQSPGRAELPLAERK